MNPKKHLTRKKKEETAGTKWEVKFCFTINQIRIGEGISFSFVLKSIGLHLIACACELIVLEKKSEANLCCVLVFFREKRMKMCLYSLYGSLWGAPLQNKFVVFLFKIYFFYWLGRAAKRNVDSNQLFSVLLVATTYRAMGSFYRRHGIEIGAKSTKRKDTR